MDGGHDRNGDPLAPAAARLTARYGPVIGEETIRQVLRETYEALLAGATVTTFLPILAERSAAARLAHTRDHRMPGAPRPIGRQDRPDRS
jgi:hypothetical protein